ncbi:hypothetical protein AVEN_202267-1 [Araneus ventricosus]|uniref:Uncharacterized protein n=1 Tax=Araneus ventricosus TaxID=182803 RepID=A0A4Y2CMK1_ARAVE|nr:hypothetical protein AVEN_202267-1 [Araneus ventricosus]
MELGDKKPSTLLFEMKSLSSDGISPELLRGVWMQRLSIGIQQIWSVNSYNLQALSKMEDSIFEISKVYLVAVESANFQSSDASKFENRLAAIENRLSRLEVRRTSLSRRNAEVHGSNKRKYCWWHFKFGKKAKPIRTAMHFLIGKLVQPSVSALTVKRAWLSVCLFMIRLLVSSYRFTNFGK